MKAAGTIGVPTTDTEGGWSDLMRRAQAGDQEAYRQLLHAITPYLRRLARRQGIPASELEDAVQDTLLTLHTVRRTYDPRRPFGPWLTAIARRRFIDQLRSRRRWMTKVAALGSAHEVASTIEVTCEPFADAHILRQAIARLPMRQRQAVTLLKLREMSPQEAAAVSGLSPPSLKVACHRALGSLRKLLVGQD